MIAVALQRRVANRLWQAVNLHRDAAFRAGLRSVAREQVGILLRLLRRNAGTEYGRRYGFEGVASVDDFRARVPLTTYEDYAPWIERIAAEQGGTLVSDPVQVLEPTSGTSGGVKLIPQTPALRADFLRGVGPWMCALYRRYPRLLAGAAYWSISPVMNAPRWKGACRVGFDNDADYLGPLGRWFHDRIMPVPSEVAVETDPSRFRRRTMAHLLACPDLALISVWSPTFLIGLLDCLVRDTSGTLEALRALPGPYGAIRAREMAALCRACATEELFTRAWPDLQLVSCWTDGPSARYAAEVRRFLPKVDIEGKGLIATEAFVSLPYLPGCDPVLAVRSHFFEFEDVESGNLRLAGELEQDRAYSVIVTTGGGLYRYRLGDRVLVTGHIGEAPTLRFLGRDASVSDQTGEKLHEIHVRAVLDHALREHSLAPAFLLVAPVLNSGTMPHYALFVQDENATDAGLMAIGKTLDTRLESNFHYGHSRRLGQLAPLRVFHIEGVTGIGWRVYEAELTRRGTRAGAVKPACLDREGGWEALFPGKFLRDGATRQELPTARN